MYAPNDALNFLFLVRAVSGAPVDADSLPTVSLFHNGAVDSVATAALAVTKLATGLYMVAGAVPNTYEAGDRISLVTSYLVSTVAASSVALNEVLQRARVLIDMTQAVPASNGVDTVGDSLNAARAQGFGRWVKDGSNLTLYRGDGTTVCRAFVLDDPDTPSSRT